MSKERILYCVWTKIDATYEKEWAEYLDRIHFPDVLKTKYFHSAKRFKVTEGKTDGNFLTVYETFGRENLEQYYKTEANRLRKDYLDHFGNKSELHRIVLEEVFSLEK